MSDDAPIMNLADGPAGSARRPAAPAPRPAVWREPTPEEAKRHGATARILDVMPGEQLLRRDPMKQLKRDLKVSSRQWKKRRKEIKRRLKARAAEAAAAQETTDVVE